MKRVLIITTAILFVFVSVEANSAVNSKKKSKSGMDSNTSKVARGEHKQVQAWQKLYKKIQRQKKSIKKRIN